MADSIAYQTTTKPTAFDFKTFAAVAVTVVAWASAFAGIRAGLQSYAPEHVALLRYATASLILLVIALRNGIQLPQRRDLLPIAILGFTGFTFYNVVLNKGEQNTASAVASLIVASAPIFVALLAKGFLKEQLTAWGRQVLCSSLQQQSLNLSTRHFKNRYSRRTRRFSSQPMRSGPERYVYSLLRRGCSSKCKRQRQQRRWRLFTWAFFRAHLATYAGPMFCRGYQRHGQAYFCILFRQRLH